MDANLPSDIENERYTFRTIKNVIYHINNGSFCFMRKYFSITLFILFILQDIMYVNVWVV